MLDRTHRLPVAKQAKILGIRRSCLYYRPTPLSAEDQLLMPRIDQWHLEFLFAGARMRWALLRQEGLTVGRKHVGTLMKPMGLEALYRKPRTTRRYPSHQVYLYLLRDLAIIRVNQV